MHPFPRRSEQTTATGPAHTGPWPAVRPAVRVRRPAPEVVQIEVEPAPIPRPRRERITRPVGARAGAPTDRRPPARARPEPAALDVLWEHLSSATGSRPTKAWSAATDVLLEQPLVRAGLRELVEALGNGTLEVDAGRAAVWAAARVDEPWVTPALHAIGRRGVANGFAGNRVLNAALACLGALGAVDELQDLADRSTLPRVKAALDVALGLA